VLGEALGADNGENRLRADRSNVQDAPQCLGTISLTFSPDAVPGARELATYRRADNAHYVKCLI
jgi:hypothetical protein